MARHAGSLSEQTRALLAAHPEIALLAAFEIGKIAARVAKRREPLGRALWRGVSDAAARTGAGAALAGMVLSMILEAPPLAPNGKRRHARPRPTRSIAVR